MPRPTAGELVRTAVTPKWLGLALVLFAFIGLCVAAGHWQWTRTQDILATERAAKEAPIPVEQVASPGQPLPNDQIARRVTATGSYRADGQVVVLHRALDGQPGIWVLTPFELSDGSVVGVLRGWLASPKDPGIVPPAGPVSITGVMEPDEPFYSDGVTLPGFAVAISTKRLGAEWGPEVRPGFIMLGSQVPAAATDPLLVPPTVHAEDVGFPFRNFGYAIQWFLFAAFGVGVYGRWLWLDALARRDELDVVPDGSR